MLADPREAPGLGDDRLRAHDAAGAKLMKAPYVFKICLSLVGPQL